MRNVSSFVMGAACLQALAGLAFSQTTFRVSVTSAGAQHDGTLDPYNRSTVHPRISGDGRYVLFADDAPRLTPAGELPGMHLFVHDRMLGTTTAMRSSVTGQIVVLDPATSIDESSPHLSRDARWVVFETPQSDLVQGDTNGFRDVFLMERSTGDVVLASLANNGAQGNANTGETDAVGPSVSEDGRFVAFCSNASNLVAGDINNVRDAFVRDLQLGTTELVNVPFAGTPHDFVISCDMSADGRYVAFTSPGPLGWQAVFVRDRLLSTTMLVSQLGGVLPDANCHDARISGDGSLVVFDSLATNLMPPATLHQMNVFAVSTTGTALELVSASSAGSEGNGWSLWGMPSFDGRFVVFDSYASDLAQPDLDVTLDVFTRDRQAGTTRIASVTIDPTAPGESGFQSSIGDDDHAVAFRSLSSAMVAGDTNGDHDVFVRDLQSPLPQPISTCLSKVDSLGCLSRVSSSGKPTVSGSEPFYVCAAPMRNLRPGACLFSPTKLSAPFHGGRLCVGGQPVMVNLPSSAGSPTGNDCSGFLSFRFDAALFASLGIPAGTTLYTQMWYRDPGYAPPNNYGLSNGLKFTTCP